MNDIILKYGLVLRDNAGDTWAVWMYNKDDVNPMAYKVALIDENARRQTFYSCDLVDLIKQGEFSIV